MLDPIYRTALQGRDWGLQSNLHTGAGDTAAQGRATNTIRYDSPTFAGFQVAGHYTVQNEDQADPNADSPWGIGGHWQGGGFLVFADYITSDAGGDDDAWKVGGRWGFDKFALFVGVHSLSKRTKVYAGYAQRDYDDFKKVSDFSLGMKHTF